MENDYIITWDPVSVESVSRMWPVENGWLEYQTRTITTRPGKPVEISEWVGLSRIKMETE